uniref:Uncharacterized protein n=1 Tax=Rhizophora mucronata TaxID=61149 RepID=A0A2P2LPW6_RHIMU
MCAYFGAWQAIMKGFKSNCFMLIPGNYFISGLLKKRTGIDS